MKCEYCEFLHGHICGMTGKRHDLHDECDARDTKIFKIVESLLENQHEKGD